MIKKLTLLASLLTGISLTASAQLGVDKETFTRADSLRGFLTPLRTCYDINYYHVDVNRNGLSSGIYYYKMYALGQTLVRKMIILY